MTKTELLSSQRELAIAGFTERWSEAVEADNKPEARWLEKCVGDLNKMTDEEFAERYKDIDE